MAYLKYELYIDEHIKKGVQVSSICGGTDIISCFMLGNPLVPVKRGEIQGLGLGMDVTSFTFWAVKSVVGWIFE